LVNNSVMLDKLKIAYKIASNIKNIRMVIEATYGVCLKTLYVIDFLEDSFGENNKSEVFTKYLPLVKDAVNAVKKTIQKYSPLLGAEQTVYLLSNSPLDIELEKAIKELHAVLDSDGKE